MDIFMKNGGNFDPAMAKGLNKPNNFTTTIGDTQNHESIYEVTNEFNYSANKGYQKTFKIDLLSNMNFYQVKKLICQELAHKKVEKVWEDPPHPAAIKLNRKVGYADRIIKDSENGMLVQELLMKTGEKIIVTPRGNGDIINVPLLDSETK